jgi:hypothetical protein
MGGGYDGKRAADFVATLKDPRLSPADDASDVVDAAAALAEKHVRPTPDEPSARRINPPLLQAAPTPRWRPTPPDAERGYLTDPFHKTGKKLGDDEYALRLERSQDALGGFVVEPGMSDYFARYAAEHLFDEIDYIGIRDGSNLDIPGAKGISFGFSVWTTIEECNNPAIVFENGDSPHRRAVRRAREVLAA